MLALSHPRGLLSFVLWLKWSRLPHIGYRRPASPGYPLLYDVGSFPKHSACHGSEAVSGFYPCVPMLDTLSTHQSNFSVSVILFFFFVGPCMVFIPESCMVPGVAAHSLACCFSFSPHVA